MATKIVKSLKFPNSTDTYQINAVALEGKSLTEIETSVDSKLSDKADKANTLAGYNITDAYTKEEVKNYIEQTLLNGEW